jgi:hypothetical protein
VHHTFLGCDFLLQMMGNCMGDREQSLNPAANVSRMVVALAVLVILGVLSWYTIDASSVIHVHGYSSRLVSFGDRDIELRWIPLLILGMFAFRVVMANMRARLEMKDVQDKLM